MARVERPKPFLAALMNRQCPNCGLSRWPVDRYGSVLVCAECANRLDLAPQPVPATRQAGARRLQVWLYTPAGDLLRHVLGEPAARIELDGVFLPKWEITPVGSVEAVALVYALQQPSPDICTLVVTDAIARWRDEPWMNPARES